MKTKTRTMQKQTAVRKPKKKTRVASKTLPAVDPKMPVLSDKHLSNLSSINIAKMLSNFMTFRSIVKDVSQGINKLEGFMDSTFSMFRVAQQMMGQSSRSRNPFSFLLPSGKAKGQDSAEDEEIPIIKFPGENRKSKKSGTPPMLGSLMENIDMNQIFKIAQSPMFQKMLSSLLKGKAASSSTSFQDKE